MAGPAPTDGWANSVPERDANEQHHQGERESAYPADPVNAGARWLAPALVTKKVFQNDWRRRQQRIEQASVRNAVWMSGSRS